MDLLNQNQYQQPQKSNSKNLIIILLVLSIIAVIAILAMMIYVSSNTEVEDTLFINNEQKELTEELVVQNENGKQYISLKGIAELLGYEYYNGEYGNDGEEDAKCYIKNAKLISGFELGSNKIYKYEENTNLDYQFYTLKNNIVTANNKLYIAIEDLSESINVYCVINQNKEIKIYTMEYLTTSYKEKLKDSGFTVTQDANNQKALAYGWIIVNKNGLCGVLDINLEEVIGTKYSSIYFDEYNMQYIVSNSNGQHGIISTSGSIALALKYDGLEILNYENMLYKVAHNGKYGIMKTEGEMLTEIVYDEIGYKADPANKILYTLIIPQVDGESGPLIVVKKGAFYGLITLETGETFLPCDHVEKLYSVRDLEKIKYNIEAEKITMDLLEYLKLRGTTVVELN